MKVKYNKDGSYEIEGTPLECASYKQLTDNQLTIKPVPVQPYNYPYTTTSSPNNPFKWNEVTCNANILNQGQIVKY